MIGLVRGSDYLWDILRLTYISKIGVNGLGGKKNIILSKYILYIIIKEKNNYGLKKIFKIF